MFGLTATLNLSGLTEAQLGAFITAVIAAVPASAVLVNASLSVTQAAATSSAPAAPNA